TSTGNVINLSENGYRFLLLLLQGESDKQHIINEVWREQKGSVSDSSYYGQIYMLRKALDVAGLSSSLIKTIPRKGVRYLGKVEKHVCENERDSDEDSSSYTNDSEAREVNTDANIPENDNSQEFSTEELLPIKHTDKNIEWYRTKQWSVFISVLTVLAVCWLTTLVFLVLLFLNQDK
ncbi:TPA: transcriptional regulator, partial [Shigella flexneri]|nr:transcriptional regulator [Shigella flexneri]HCS1640762.1 transcriptional regulator [Shigella flexneri]HCS2922063.1 transcriptional regulator [Shigella flexneri]